MSVQEKNKSFYLKLFSVCAFAAAFVVSSTFYCLKHNNVRRIMYFPSYNTVKLCSEIRYFPRKCVQGAEAAFVDDLLLGPMTNRYSKLFPRGTKAEYCFVDNTTDTLYVGLNDAALFESDILSVEQCIELLRLNIVKNFTYLNKIEVAIDGRSVCENGGSAHSFN